MRLLASPAGLGRKIDDIRPGYLKFPAASHIIFYRKIVDGIEVIRILHRSVDAGRHI